MGTMDAMVNVMAPTKKTMKCYKQFKSLFDSEYHEAKHDQGKPRFDLIDPYFEEELAEVMAHGSEKYGDNSWQSVPDGLARYHGALRRHLVAVKKGELIDPDSGLTHMAHVSANAMFISYLLRENETK